MAELFAYQLQSDMFDANVRIGRVIHVKGATIDQESPSDAMKEFIEEESFEPYVTNSFESVWSGYTGLINGMVEEHEEEAKEDRRSADQLFICEVADLFSRRCPKQFIVEVQYQVNRCTKANRKGEGLGSWYGGWGHVACHWMLVDDIAEAAQTGIQLAKEQIRAEWQKAIDEGRVYPLEVSHG